MLLAIDVGNTNTVLALFPLAPATEPTPSAPVADWRITTQRDLTADEFGILFRDLFALRGLELSAVTGVAISSVVPPLDSTLKRATELYFHTKPLFVEPGTRTGIPILTDNPHEVGADRIVNCIAAHEYAKAHAKLFARSQTNDGPPGPDGPNGEPAASATPIPAVIVPAVIVPAVIVPAVIVVDLGTATTFDVVSSRGEFLGGAIAPGLRVSADALFSRAARLPRIDIRKPPKVIGTNTVDNLQIGLYYGYIGLVDGILARMIDELGPSTRTIATGGLAPLIASGSRYINEVDELLTLTGLRLLYERNHHNHRTRA